MKRYGIVLALLAVSAVLVLSAARHAPDRGERRLAELPSSFGEWELVEELTFPERVFRQLGTGDVLGRIYRHQATGRLAKIVAVRAVNNRGAFHPPEYCLTGAGSEIVERGERRSVAGAGGMTVNEMVLLTESKSRLYACTWYAAGPFITSNYYLQQLRLVLDELRSGAGTGAVISVYVPVESDHVPEAREAGQEFVRALVPVLREKRIP